MNINVNSIISNIESALKASASKSGEATQEKLPPRMINPARKDKKDPSMSFQGKTLVGRMYVDGNGVPFRNISWMSSLYLPYLNENGQWYSRNIRTCASGNFVGITEAQKKLNRELEDTMRSFKAFASEYNPHKGYDKEAHEPIYSVNREVIAFYFKPGMIMSNGTPVGIPDLGPASYIYAEKQGLLQAMLTAFQSENQMNPNGWADEALGRNGPNKMSVVLSATYAASAKSYNWSFAFKAAKPVDLTQEDLDMSLDINNEVISNIFDEERATRDLEFLREQFDIRSKNAKEGFSEVAQPEVSVATSSEFKKAEAAPSASDDGDIPF